MAPLADYFVLAIALCGHTAGWIYLDNRFHATGLPRRAIKLVSWITRAALVLVAATATLVYLPVDLEPWGLQTLKVGLSPVVGAYLLLCIAIGMVGVPWELWRRWRSRSPVALQSNHTSVVALKSQLPARPIRGLEASLLTRLPGNQIFDIHVHEKTLLLDRLPAALDGLSVVHLSDLHMSGHIDVRFHEEVVRIANDLQPDLMLLTGDLIESEECLGWIDSTLAKLRCPQPPYFILGNHDKRLPDPAILRGSLQAAGLVDLGGRATTLLVRGETVLLAGIEIPWFGSTPDLTEADAGNSDKTGLRILMSHSPDQIAWARRNRFDLMLAGHTHGGQIRLPLLGPVISPSYYGTRYASGTFYEPPTLMHVSRGVCGLTPLRWNCPPEIAKLTLRQGPALIKETGHRR